ncbi:MAG: hypothetical protein KIS64_06310 [Fimbriimonadaceae bacterium]|nr:hypothetical protein [Fimbriimonadaceae bacterium]
MQSYWRTPLRTSSVVGALLVSACSMALYGITWETGALYSIDPNNAALTKVGDTNVKFMADIQMGADGYLYGFTTGLAAKTYKIDPSDGKATELKPVALDEGTFVFEGAMAESNGDVYWCSAGMDAGHAKFFEMNVKTGEVLDSFTVEGAFDINGWVRAYTDGDELYGLDRESMSIVVIDLMNRTSYTALGWPGDVGEVGGMTYYGNDVYIATGGTGSVIPGSNKLFRAQIAGTFTTPVEVGTFSGIGDYGFSGIAAPEPSILLAAGMAALVLRRKRK